MVLVVVGFFYVVVSSQLFQMVAHYNCTVKQYLKNALLVGIAHPLCLIANIGLGILPYFAFFYNFGAFLQLTLVWILGIFSFQGYLSGIMSKKFYQRITEQLSELQATVDRSKNALQGAAATMYTIRPTENENL